MELINTGNDLLDAIFELLFLHHPGFYPAATPAHRRVTANPEVFRHFRQRPVAMAGGERRPTALPALTVRASVPRGGCPLD